MTIEEMEDAFERCYEADEFLCFEKVKDKLSKRPDLHAFLRLDQLFPKERDMVCAAEHDEIWLDVDSEELATIATEDLVVELVRCGVMLSEGALCMFA